MKLYVLILVITRRPCRVDTAHMGADQIQGTSFDNKVEPSADRGEVPWVGALARDGFPAGESGETPGHGHGPALPNVGEPC